MPSEPRTSIAAMIAARPRDAMALAASAYRLSYGQLNDRSTILAQGLRILGAGASMPVGVFAGRTPTGVLGALAVLKAGSCYVPLDPANPPERLAHILRDVCAPFVLAEREIAGRIPKGSWKVIPIDTAAAPPSRPSRPLPDPAPDHLAYIAYTSGSTGKPQGVEITHAGLLNLIAWHRRAFQITDADNASQLAAPGFDAAVWEIWPYLTAGASLHFPDDRDRRSVRALQEWLIDEYISVAFAPSSMAEQLMALEWPRAAALRFLLTGGDVLRQYPRAGLPFILVNNYGPTEGTVVATSTHVAPQSSRDGYPPVGRPIDNVRILILNDALDRVPEGTTGEICIGGPGLARGYVNQPELTARKFIPDTFCTDPHARLYRTGDLGWRLPDGRIAFAGRMDDQIQIRGYRVEPFEIENALNSHPAVKDSVAAARELSPGERILVAYVVPSDAAPTPAALDEWLRERLPEFMVPSAYVFIAEFPLTPHGKVDRAALPAPRHETQESVLREIEARLAQIVAAHLEVEQVGCEENIFSIAGQPLVSVVLLDRIRQVFGVSLTAGRLQESPTVAGLALEIARAESLLRQSK